MVSILAFVHIILSIFLVVLVLIQDPKGGAAGGMFGGGGSNSLFGATGAPSFLSRLTRWVAALFAASCILMTISIKPGGDSVLDSVDVPAQTQPTVEEKMDAAPELEPTGEEPQTETE